MSVPVFPFNPGPPYWLPPLVGPSKWDLSQTTSVVIKVKDRFGATTTLPNVTFDAAVYDTATSSWTMQVNHPFAHDECAVDGYWDGKVFIEGTFPEGSGEVLCHTFQFQIEKEF